MIRVLPESATYYDIHGRVVQAEVDFDATQFEDRERRLEAARRYLGVLNEAAREITAWEEDVHSKITQCTLEIRKSAFPILTVSIGGSSKRPYLPTVN